jgi:hypothetical protein
MSESMEFRDAEAQAAHAAIKRAVWKASVWCWPACIVTFFLFFGVVAGFIPPPQEDWSAQRVAEFYAADRTGIRIGLIGALFASALMLPWFNVVSREMRRIEGRGALLAPLQFGAAVILIAFVQIICLLWLLASFRPESDPDVVRAANDYGWLVWTILIPTYSMQFVCMAIAGFMDGRRVVLWPRWAAYGNLWVAFLGAGGCLSVFFKNGPFSWNGIVGWWIPTVVFAIGMTVNTWLLLRYARLSVAVADEQSVDDRLTRVLGTDDVMDEGLRGGLPGREGAVHLGLER